MRFGITVALLVLSWFCFLLSSVVGQDECPEGFDRSFQNSCYKLFDSKINWEKAEGACNEDKAHLVYIESDEEQQFIADWQNNTDGPNSWIGLSRQVDHVDEVGDFMWSDDSPASYMAWRSGAPTNFTDRNCVRLVKGQYYRWANRMCSETNTYICEIEAIGCPSNWHFFNDFCYFVEDARMEYDEARDECIKLYATLSSITSQEEQYLHNRFEKIYNDDLWIGLNDKGSDSDEGMWKWEDQSMFNFTNWADNEPNDENGEDCVVLWKDKNGEWNDEDCSDKKKFICKRATACPEGWHFYNNFCFFVNTEQRKTYDEARDACIGMNATLTSIGNSEDQYVHTRFFTASGNKDNLWIGLNDKSSEGIWKWEDESNYEHDEFNNWDDNQPDDYLDNEDCAHLWNNGKWNDNNCDARIGYICKQALPIPTTPAPSTTLADVTTATTLTPSTEPGKPTTANQPEHPTTCSPAATTRSSVTNIEGTRQPRNSGLALGDIVGVVVGIILFLLLIVLIVVLAVNRSRRITQTKQAKQGKTTFLLVNGTYDQTIEGNWSHSKQSTVQPIYTDPDGNKQSAIGKKQNQYVNSSLNVSSAGINESSTDENAGVVYEDVSKCENQRAVVNDDDQETSLYNAKSNAQQSTSKTREEIAVDHQQESLYYAKSDSYSGSNDGPRGTKEHEDSDSLYYATSNLDTESDGHPLSKAQQDSCMEPSLYYAKSTGDHGDTEQSPGDDVTTGWEENAAYSSYGDDEPAYSSKDECVSSTTGASAERKRNYNALHDSKYSQASKQEGWAECALYGESDKDDDEEEWAENKIYAGSDCES